MVLLTTRESHYDASKYVLMEKRKMLLPATIVHSCGMANPTVPQYFCLSACLLFVNESVFQLFADYVLWARCCLRPRETQRGRVCLWAWGCSLKRYWTCPQTALQLSLLGIQVYSSSTVKLFPEFYKNALSYLLNLNVSSLQLSALILKEGIPAYQNWKVILLLNK